jgi:hypothetical protein
VLLPLHIVVAGVIEAGLDEVLSTVIVTDWQGEL